MSRKLLFELTGEKEGLFCQGCTFLNDDGGVWFCKLFSSFLRQSSDGYDAYRCPECMDAEQK
jgi:hypothetical protein